MSGGLEKKRHKINGMEQARCMCDLKTIIIFFAASLMLTKKPVHSINSDLLYNTVNFVDNKILIQRANENSVTKKLIK